MGNGRERRELGREKDENIKLNGVEEKERPWGGRK